VARSVFAPSEDTSLFLCRVPRPIHRLFYGTSDAILASIELASNRSILGKGSANSLANLSNVAIRVELLADGALRGDDARVRRTSVLFLAGCLGGVVDGVLGRHGSDS